MVTELCPAAVEADLDEVYAEWLQARGGLVNRLEFLVGERGEQGRAVPAHFRGAPVRLGVPYITYYPAYGAWPGWLYDLTRRRPDAPVGTIELITTPLGPLGTLRTPPGCTRSTWLNTNAFQSSLRSRVRTPSLRSGI